MDQFIRRSTELFLSKLDDDREFYKPVDLLNAGYPDFLVKRMRLELIRNLQDSVKPPHSDWANMDTEAVQYAWHQFLDAIHEEIRLPASYVKPVLESALGDIFELMVAPRAFLPDYIFGSDSELKIAAVKERCEWIVIYTYFATAIPRFMEKREKEVLTREQTIRIVQRLDERVTEHYTSLNWAQLFGPWFKILGERIEPSLFARFFRDKDKPGVARHFDEEPDAIDRTRLIEILSRPHIDDDDIDDIVEEAGKPGVTKKEEDSLPIPVSETASETGKKEKEKEKISEEDNLWERFRRTGDTEEEEPLHTRLRKYSPEKEEEDQPLYSRIMAPNKVEEDETPIWQRFTSGWQSGEKGNETENRIDPVQRVSDEPQEGSKNRSKDEKLEEIRRHVRDLESDFVNEIFGGDENAMLEALENISACEEWKEAGNYINREVFNRNMIDIYSDMAIYFTDRMQTYFLERR